MFHPTANPLLNVCQKIHQHNKALTAENEYLKDIILENQLNTENYYGYDEQNQDQDSDEQEQEPEQEDGEGEDDNGKVTFADIQDFANRNGKQSWVIFYGKGCPHCHHLFEDLGFGKINGLFKVPLGSQVLPRNVLALEGEDISKDLGRQMGVNGFPDVRYFENGREKRWIDPESDDPESPYKDLRKSLVKYVERLREIENGDDDDGDDQGDYDNQNVNDFIGNYMPSYSYPNLGGGPFSSSSSFGPLLSQYYQNHY